MDEKRKDTEEQKNTTNTRVPPVRSMVLWLLAGIYLLYIGYNLCKGVLDGQEGTGWGFFAAGVFFIIIGVGMLFFAAKSYNAKIKADREAEIAAKNKEDIQEAEEETLEEEPSEVKTIPTKPMTITERARLASRLEDSEEDTE